MKEYKRNNINYGISILRVILSLMVVFDHFYDYKTKIKFTYILYYHIPTFFVLSFYFTYKTFISVHKVPKIKKRFERLLIPYFGWSIISWILFNIYFYIFKEKVPHTVFSFLQHLLCGRIYFQVLWFQNILILITLIISIIVLLFKKNQILIFQILMIICLSLQYSGKNYKFFKKHFDSNYYMTYGRIVEAYPNAITGFFLSYINIYDKLKTNKRNTVLINIIVLIFISKYKFDANLLSFRYGGLRRMSAAICIFISFYFLPFENIKNEKIKKIINIIAGYNAGIYFIHCLIGRSKIMKKILNRRIRKLSGFFSIYFISYIICFILDKLIGNTFLKHMIK